jgi:hypothetical protein
MVYAVEMTSGGMTHTKFHDDRFNNSSNTKGITSTTWEAVVLVPLMEGIYKLRNWIGFRCMISAPGSIKIRLAIQKLMGGGYTYIHTYIHTGSKVISLAYFFQNEERS